jgi:hypothetical protein
MGHSKEYALNLLVISLKYCYCNQLIVIYDKIKLLNAVGVVNYVKNRTSNGDPFLSSRSKVIA